MSNLSQDFSNLFTKGPRKRKRPRVVSVKVIDKTINPGPGASAPYTWEFFVINNLDGENNDVVNTINNNISSIEIYPNVGSKITLTPEEITINLNEEILHRYDSFSFDSTEECGNNFQIVDIAIYFKEEGSDLLSGVQIYNDITLVSELV